MMEQVKSFFQAFNSYISLIILNYIFIFLFRLWEIIMIAGAGKLPEILNGFAGDIVLVNLSLLAIYIPYALVWLWKPKTAAFVFGILMSLFYILSIPVQAYYNITGEIISAENFQCGTLSAWFFTLKNIPVVSFLIPLLLFMALAAYLNHTIRHHVHVFPKIAVNFFAFLLIIAIPAGFELGLNSDFFTKNQHRVNKSFHFAASSMRCTFGTQMPSETVIAPIKRYQVIRGKETYLADDEYPLLRKAVADQCLSPYFKETNDGLPPNVVIVIVEGLGDKFLHPINQISFMPFMEELKRQSLYWKNFLATSNGLQNTMGSVLGGLPYGEKGFSILPIMPRHFTFINVLGFNNYYSSYVTGRHAWNQFTDKLLIANETDSIWDASDFGDGFDAIHIEGTNWFWGYNDSDLLNFYFEKRKETQCHPRLEIIQTGSMHDPWPVNNEEFYKDEYIKMISTIGNTATREHFEQFEKQYISLMYTDDVLKNFFNSFSDHERFQNTIFIITGNYPMRNLSCDESLEKYHVPLLVYSPLLKQTKVFENISSHKDIYDSFISLMAKNYGLTTPGYSTSIGHSLCSNEDLKVFIPFMDRDNKISELVYGNFFLTSDAELFEIDVGLKTIPSNDTQKLKELKSILNAFREVNTIASQALIPDLLFFDFLDYMLLEDNMIRGGTFRREYVSLLEEMQLDSGYRYYLDAAFVRPRISLEEVYLVYELSDGKGNSLIWKNFGIPQNENEGFSVKEIISTENLSAEGMQLRVFLWNESPVPYHFDQARITLYRNK